MKTRSKVQLLFGIVIGVLLAVTWGYRASAQRGAGAGAGQAAGQGGGRGRGAAAPLPPGDQGDIDAMYRIDQKKGPVDLGLTDPALIDAIDIHAHLEPTVPRSATEGGLDIDYEQMAHLAKLRGLSGYVQKSHSDMSSAVNAYMVRTHIEPSLQVYGRFPMNLSTGGINMASVAHFATIKGGWGRVIEMPTWDAEFRTAPPRAPAVEERPWIAFLPPGAPKWVSISKNGQLLPEVTFLIDALPKIRTADSGGRLALATGHSSGEEDLLLAREGRKVGLQVTAPHGYGGPGDMNPEQTAEYVKLGGFLEVRNSSGASNNIEKVVKAIQTYGAGAFIVSSDCGFMNYPLHTDCLALIARAMRLHGINEKDIDTMFKDNPRKFLSLPPRRPMSTAANR